jgi:EAL domain-containing protein (putative c-di-GMP-specific phosphodiesterase class I)
MRRLPTRHEIERLLESGGPEIVFQPIFELETQRITGLEALSRFPGGGFFPGAWFEGAHRHGLGTELELAAVAAALEYVDLLPDDVRLAVNVSPAVAAMDALLEWVRPSARRIVVEITESYRTESYEVLALALARVRAAGAAVAADDVGAGFSTLDHVRAIAPDVVKLDLSLTRAAGLTREGRVQARSFIEAARDVGASVAAEGIETAAELATMRDLGVDHGQGFYLAEPAELDSFLAPEPLFH